MMFRATLQANGRTATGVEVPEEVVTALGAGRRPPVSVTVNGYTWRTSIASMGGRFMIGISAQARAGAGVTAGDVIEVDVEHDTAPREVDVADDLAAALAAAPAARARFEALPYSHQRRYVEAVEATKKPQTRANRIARAIETLEADPATGAAPG